MISEDLPALQFMSVENGSIQEYEKQKAVVEYIEVQLVLFLFSNIMMDFRKPNLCFRRVYLL